jgi:glycerate 2-kinase
LLVRALEAHPLPSALQLNVVAAGKAARLMLDALVATHRPRVGDVVLALGSHPVPDAYSVESARRALALAGKSRESGHMLVVLLSGGASAMLAAPADDLTLDDKIAVTRLLLRGGLPIADMNAVRKHLSAIKGGQLGAQAGQSMTFAISDVHAPIEDDPAIIGSGPTVGDPSTFADAVAAAQRANIWDRLPASVRNLLAAGARGDRVETVKPGDPRLDRAHYVLAGSRRDAMLAAAGHARSRGFHTVTVDQPTLGEAARAAEIFVRTASNCIGPRPACVIASGETTVRVTGQGIGGRNQEFALAAAAHLNPLGPCALASVGTDGIDGPTDAAGAIVDTTTLERARRGGLDATAALRDHNTYPFFNALGDLVVTGPTGTNVGDLQVLLVGNPRTLEP